jgi:hypothetical protein
MTNCGVLGNGLGPSLQPHAAVQPADGDEAADMPWSELEKDDLWLIPKERYKTKIDVEIPLSGAARDALNATARLGEKFVFTMNGETPISGFSK